MAPLILRPNPDPFNFIDKWRDPIWKRPGVYLWSIEHGNAHLVSYAGQTFRGSSNFETRIWQEFTWWKSGKDWPVDIEQWKRGVRVELPRPAPAGHATREIEVLSPLIRLWLMPLDTQPQCDQAERWLVAELCKHSITRQFLANRNPQRYRPDPCWPVRVEAPPSFRVFGLTVPATTVGAG